MIIMILSIKLRNCGNPNENLQNMSADKKKADRYHPLDIDYEQSKLIFPNQKEHWFKKPTKADKEYYDRQVQIKKQAQYSILKWGTIIVGSLVLLYILLS